ncbi:hypothetical protein GCM10010149_18310 [Nonomuraea roseoviolacea subsp. roseoviolacea]|uniref:hypothetical protein n=1 Tax=Nonomuraea roseoviolacea TaxID=103837 RepID=UPI0031D71C25
MSRRPGSRRWWALIALVPRSPAVGFDVTILNLALPSMAEDLHADNARHARGTDPPPGPTGPPCPRPPPRSRPPGPT